MKTEEILIIAAIVGGLYLLSKQSGGKATAGLKQTSPFQNNPNTGVNSNQGNSEFGDKALAYLNKNGKQLLDIGKGVGGAIGGIFNGNNNASGNDSFDDLDEMGTVSGGWGSGDDAENMTA